MKEVAGQKNEVNLDMLLRSGVHWRKNAKYTYIVLYSQLQNFFEGVDRVLTAYWIAFHVPDVVVCREHDSDGIIGNFVTVSASEQLSYNGCLASILNCWIIERRRLSV